MEIQIDRQNIQWKIEGKIIELWKAIIFQGVLFFKSFKGNLYSQEEYNNLKSFLGPEEKIISLR